MKAQLRVLSGLRKGMFGVFSKDVVALGRHPAADLPLDPDHDLDVSSRHAEIARAGPHWVVRDVGSRNGTLVNGHPIRGDTRLADTDQIRLGPDGPHVEFRLVPDNTPDHRPVPTPPADRRTGGPGDEGVGDGPRETADHHMLPPRQSTTERIRMEVGRQTRRLRSLTVVLIAVFVVVAGAFLWDRQRQERGREREVAALQSRIDSILAAADTAMASLQGRVEGLAAALRRSQADVQELHGQLAVASRAGNREQVRVLQRRLADATAALRTQQLAAEVDYGAINETNHLAVAMIWVEFAPGDVQTGTAFAVTPGGRMVTNRHVVAGADGARRPRRIAVQFTNSTQVWRARLLAAHRDADLALVQVEGIVGSVPTVARLPDDASAVRPGDPIALIGFPHGDDLPMRSRGEHPVIRTSFTAGIVSKVLPELLQLDGYGAQGASGSPMFDRNGELVGVLYGGQPGTDGRIVFGVPVGFVRELLASLP